MTEPQTAPEGRKKASQAPRRAKGADTAQSRPRADSEAEAAKPAPILQEQDVPFPIMGRLGRKVTSVPFALADSLRAEIEKRMGRSLEATARLGGLTAFEFACVLLPDRFKPGRKTNAHEAEDAILQALDEGAA